MYFERYTDWSLYISNQLYKSRSSLAYLPIKLSLELWRLCCVLVIREYVMSSLTGLFRSMLAGAIHIWQDVRVLHQER